MAMNVDIYDVIVIGAGVAGLTAAFDLMKKRPKCKLLVLEATGEIGGRIKPVLLKGKKGAVTFDLGGAWVCRNQKNITGLLKEFKLETYEQYTVGSKLYELNNGERTSCRDEIPAGFFSMIEFYLTTKKIDNMRKEVPVDEPEKCPHAAEWDGMTVETFKQQSFWSASAKRLFDLLVTTLFGLSPCQISLLHFLHCCNTTGGIETACTTRNGGAQEWKVKDGLFQICKNLHENIGAENVLLNHAVTSISQDDDRVEIATSNGKLFHSKYCISATPPDPTARIDFTPDLPHNRRYLMTHMLRPHCIKFIATYESPFWREAGLSGELYRFTSNKESCQLFPVGAVLDGTTDGNDAALIGFITGYAASYWAPKSDEEKKQAILDTLRSFFGSKANKPIDFAIKDWSDEKYSGGCPASVISPGGITSYGDVSQRKPFQRIHWAGTETATVWRGYAEGAVETGYRAAKEVIDRLNS